MVAGIHWHWGTLGHTRWCCEFGDSYSILIGAYNRPFPCMEANYSYAIKNQRGASKIPSHWGILRSKAPSRGLWMLELVLYGIDC